MKTDNHGPGAQSQESPENQTASAQKTEEALRKSEEKYRMLFESSRDALMTIAPPTWKFTRANQAALKLFGVASEGDFTALGPWDVSPEHQPDGRPSAEKALEMIATAMREGSHFFEWEHRRLHGENFAADVLLTRMEIDGHVSMQATVRDITERKRAENMLRASEERHRLILGTAMDGFWLVDMQGHLLEVNEAYCGMSGYSEQELLTMSISDLEAAELPADTTIHVRKIISEGEDRFESVHRRKDGSTFAVEVSAQFKPIEGGLIVGFIRDRTARNKGEASLKQSEETLRMRTKELEETNIALKVFLKQREQDQKDIEEKVRTNVKQLVLPYIEKLKKRRLGEDAAYLNIIESNLQGVISSLATTTSDKLRGLTPQELLVANLIRDGRQDKDISELLNLSVHTIKAHRRNIRKKLGLTKGKANLRSFLSNL
jgi:PAS domain S-box-containing protein